MLPERFRTGREDDGVTLVLAALVLTGLLTITALVVDLGYVRASARADQSIADLAALAGAQKLEEERYVEACEDMIDYLNRNASGMPAIEASGFCGPMGGTICTDGPAAQAAPTTTSGKYTVTIEFPVPDDVGVSDYPAMGAGHADGVPCDRMRVTVRSVEPTFFGGVVGASEYEVTRSATLRAGPGESAKAPALWLLEPYGCNALATGGSNTSIVVGDMNPSPTPEDPFPAPIEGLITVDSDGTRSGGPNGCSGNSVTINVSQGSVHALPTTEPADPEEDIGEIRGFAMSRWATGCEIPACTAADVTAGRLAPQPTHVPRRATRAPVDHRWNCKTGYPDYDVGAGAGFPGLKIPDCPWTEVAAPGESQPRAPYLDKLRTLVGTTGAPLGFSTYPRPSTADSCNVSGAVVLPAGNWFVNCNTLTVSGGNSITFTGGNVVTRGGITSTGTGVVTFNSGNPVATLPAACTPLPAESLCSSSSANASWLYMRAGDLDIKGPFSAFNTMVYFQNGAIKLTGGGSFTWTAPTEGPFAGLAAWAEKPDAYQVTGGGTVTMAGAFFTPFANSMSISGGGIWNVKEAQYISRRLSASGGANLVMAPNPVRALTLPPKEGFLIR